MAFDFAALKSRSRQALHDALAVPADYIDEDLVMPAELTVRWHNKINRFNSADELGLAEYIEGIDRVIFNIPQLEAQGVVLKAGGEVTLTHPAFEGAVLVLSAKEPQVGPIEEIWLVGKRT
jgi:hypothetical protein